MLHDVVLLGVACRCDRCAFLGPKTSWPILLEFLMALAPSRHKGEDRHEGSPVRGKRILYPLPSFLGGSPYDDAIFFELA